MLQLRGTLQKHNTTKSRRRQTGGRIPLPRHPCTHVHRQTDRSKKHKICRMDSEDTKQEKMRQNMYYILQWNHMVNTHKQPFNGPLWWLGSRVVTVLDSDAEGPESKSQLRRCRVTVLGKLFTPIVPLLTKQRNW